MQLRVRPEAEKGHVVGGETYAPGETLPGEFDRIPVNLEHKLEPVPKGGADKRIAEMREHAAKLRREADELDAKATAFKAEEEQKLLDAAAKAREKAEKKAGHAPEAAPQVATEPVASPPMPRMPPAASGAGREQDKGKR